MKILYAIQGTGNGHLSRSMDVVPCLMEHGDVDVLVSGIQGDLTLPFPVKYKFRGLSFIFGKTGGVSLWKTFAKTNFRRLRNEIMNLPVEGYDLVINDFEPVSAWACYFKNKPCVSLSHQSAVLAPGSPRPEHEDMMGKLILNNYAPGTAAYGFHFTSNNDTIFTPVIRGQVRNREVSDKGHYTVYLPSYDDKRLIKRLSAYKGIKWEVFSKHNKKAVTSGNITVQPINNEKFTQSMASSTGVLCGAGFETPAEALFLGKKLLVIPMKSQYEQHLNAAALKAMGVPVVKSLKSKHEPAIWEWLGQDKRVTVNYPDITQQVIDMVIKKHAPVAAITNESPETTNGA
jgi:uncharacterized protein (TIGR00661 family)